MPNNQTDIPKINLPSNLWIYIAISFLDMHGVNEAKSFVWVTGNTFCLLTMEKGQNHSDSSLLSSPASGGNTLPHPNTITMMICRRWCSSSLQWKNHYHFFNVHTKQHTHWSILRQTLFQFPFIVGNGF